jgi:hypothetical protein
MVVAIVDLVLLLKMLTNAIIKWEEEEEIGWRATTLIELNALPMKREGQRENGRKANQTKCIRWTKELIVEEESSTCIPTDSKDCALFNLREEKKSPKNAPFFFDNDEEDR